MQNGAKPKYTSRLIKASALLADTKILLDAWHLDQTVQANLERLRQQNLFGKTSRRRLEDVLRIFRQRYFTHPEVGAALVTLNQNGAPAQWVDPLLYFFSAQNDATLRAVVLDVLYPRKLAGYVDLPAIVVQNAVRAWVDAGLTTSKWSDKTILRVTRNALAALRDYGVLEGKAHKHIAPVYLPLQSFALIAFWLMGDLQSSKQVLHSDEWRLFFLDLSAVERLFLEAHQEGLLTYYAAGSVVRLEFPAPTLEEYARGLLRRQAERAR
ncbi:MAG: BrxA family protein [Candidatus Flexifilum sp.]